MNAEKELFRILVGPAHAPRDLEAEHSRIDRLKRGVISVLAPLGMEDRLVFKLDICTLERKQWLWILARPSKQMALFECGEQAGTEGADWSFYKEDKAATLLAKQSFELLQRLCMAMTWTPADFFDILKVPEYRDLMLFASPTEPTEFQCGGQPRCSVPALEIPRRQVIQEDVDLEFRVKMVGLTEAIVELPQAARTKLRPRGRKVPLAWIWDESHATFDKLLRHLKSGSNARATVRSIIDKSGCCVSLELCHLFEC